MARWLVGVALLVLGGFVSCGFWSVGVLVDPECRFEWDTKPGCREVRRNAWASTALPLSGLIVIGVAATRAVRQPRAATRPRESRG